MKHFPFDMRLAGPDMADIKGTRHCLVFLLITLGKGGNLHANSDLINLGLGRQGKGRLSLIKQNTKH